MRGYFGIGVENISKAYNVGNLVRSAHSFGASFFFAVTPGIDMQELRVADTAASFDHMPYYEYDSPEAVDLPRECTMVGIEFVDESIDLPSFRHPVRAAYVLGPEMGSLSPAMMTRCAHVVKIPMSFCVNVGVAGAIVMYDRLLSMGRFADRPVKAGGPTENVPQHNFGSRRKVRAKSD